MDPVPVNSNAVRCCCCPKVTLTRACLSKSLDLPAVSPSQQFLPRGLSFLQSSAVRCLCKVSLKQSSQKATVECYWRPSGKSSTAPNIQKELAKYLMIK